MHNTDDSIDQDLIEALKFEYYSQLHRSIPRADPLLDKAVIKAAKICQELECDPAIYVAAQIKFWTPLDSVRLKQFLPSQLAGPKAIDNVNQFRSIVNRGNTWKGCWEVQKRRLALILQNTQRTIEEILLDSTYNFDPWFRCIITKEEIPSVVKKWGGMAYENLKIAELRSFLDELRTVEGTNLDYQRILRRYDRQQTID